MRIINKKFNEFSADIRRAIRSLSLRSEGHALYDLSSYPDTDIFACFDDNNMLIGWASCNDYPIPRVMMYVRQSMRRKGIASMLIDEIGKKYNRFDVCPWDHKSRRFFQKQMKKPLMIGVATGWRL